MDAAKDYLRFSRVQNSPLVALFTEQAALCYLKAGHARQFAFQSVLAGHQYNLAGQRKHSLRCYTDAVDVYRDRGWKVFNICIAIVINYMYIYMCIL